MLSEDVSSVQKQEENMEDITEGVEGVNGVRAEADEDVRRPKPAARPHTPTRAEIYEHEVTHLPYRSWYQPIQTLMVLEQPLRPTSAATLTSFLTCAECTRSLASMEIESSPEG